MRVRVVDDEALVAELIAINLTIAGHTVDMRTSADDLLDADLWRDVDVVVTDLMMPGVSGEELCSWLAATAPHVRRVVLTASGRDPADVDAHASLDKPIAMEQLFVAVTGSDDAG